MRRETRGDVHQIKRERKAGEGMIFAVNQSKQKGVSLGDELGGIKANWIWCVDFCRALKKWNWGEMACGGSERNCKRNSVCLAPRIHISVSFVDQHFVFI